MRPRASIGFLMPATAALLVGIVIGTYVVAPIVEGSGNPGSGRLGASPQAVAGPPTRGSASPATGSASGPPRSSGRPAASLGAGASALPRASQRPVSSLVPVPTPTGIATAKEAVVPILYYHRVEDLPRGFAGWSKASRDSFLVDDLMPYALIRQLDWLKAHGYTTILPRDLAAHWDSGKPLPKRPVILTFDDGFAHWRSFVLPELTKRKMVAEFYVVIANVGRSITWDDVRTLAKAGMGIGAHDVLHFQLAGGGVPTASRAVMQNQVTEAKRLIENNLGVTVDSMAYVGGGFNATLLQIVEQAGYTTARSIERGVIQTPGIRYHLHVSRVSWHDDVTDLYNGRMASGLPAFAKRVSGANPG